MQPHMNKDVLYPFSQEVIVFERIVQATTPHGRQHCVWCTSSLSLNRNLVRKEWLLYSTDHLTFCILVTAHPNCHPNSIMFVYQIHMSHLLHCTTQNQAPLLHNECATYRLLVHLSSHEIHDIVTYHHICICWNYKQATQSSEWTIGILYFCKVWIH